MILIAHRGNTQGPNKELENHPDHIFNALRLGYHCEIDVWFIDGKFKLGHDNPQYDFPFDLFHNYFSKLWIHCKNIEALIQLQKIDSGIRLNYFWHDQDYATLTSKGFIWSIHNIENGIVVMPEATSTEPSNIVKGICSDYIAQYA